MHMHSKLVTLSTLYCLYSPFFLRVRILERKYIWLVTDKLSQLQAQKERTVFIYTLIDIQDLFIVFFDHLLFWNTNFWKQVGYLTKVNTITFVSKWHEVKWKSFSDIAWCKDKVQHFGPNVCFSLDFEYSEFKSTLFGVS